MARNRAKTRILILCTGNSCRSQMAEGFLKSLDPSLDVHSAGTSPAAAVHPKAIWVMRELGIDISRNVPKSVDEFTAQEFDYVVTVCDSARESCPVFTGNVLHRFHMGFDDPGNITGSEENMLGEFRRVRDEIKTHFTQFCNREILRNT